MKAVVETDGYGMTTPAFQALSRDLLTSPHYTTAPDIIFC